MKETQEILKQMGFENPNDNVWQSEWFGYFLLAEDATPNILGQFIYDRGIDRGITHETNRHAECTASQVECDKCECGHSSFFINGMKAVCCKCYNEIDIEHSLKPDKTSEVLDKAKTPPQGKPVHGCSKCGNITFFVEEMKPICSECRTELKLSTI